MELIDKLTEMYKPITFENIQSQRKYNSLNPDIYKLIEDPNTYYAQRTNSELRSAKNPENFGKNTTMNSVHRIHELLEEISEATNNKTYMLKDGSRIYTDKELKNLKKKEMKKK